MQYHETRSDWREWRRRRAWSLKQQGWKQKDSALALGVTPGAVSQWCARARMGGVEALPRRRASGCPPKLTPKPSQISTEALAPGAEAYGFRGQVWTAKRISHLIGLHCRVLYHPAHMCRLLHGRLECAAADPACQRARRSSDQSVVGGALASAQKKAAEERRTIIWIDQLKDDNPLVREGELRGRRLEAASFRRQIPSRS